MFLQPSNFYMLLLIYHEEDNTTKENIQNTFLINLNSKVETESFGFAGGIKKNILHLIWHRKKNKEVKHISQKLKNTVLNTIAYNEKHIFVKKKQHLIIASLSRQSEIGEENLK